MLIDSTTPSSCKASMSKYAQEAVDFVGAYTVSVGLVKQSLPVFAKNYMVYMVQSGWTGCS